MFLDEPRWQTVPWELDPKTKTPQSHLLDIFVTVPGILGEDKRLEGSIYQAGDLTDDFSLILDDDALRRTELCARIAVQLEKLYAWRWDWQRQYGHHVSLNPAGWDPDSAAARALGGPASDSTYASRLEFTRPVLANDIMLYNSVLMWLLALLWKLEPLRAGEIIGGCARRARPPTTPVPPPPTFPSASPACYSQGSRGSSTASSSPAASSLSPGGARGSSRASSPTSSLSFHPLRAPGALRSIRDPAVEICRAYEWQSRHHGHHQQQTCLYLFPVGMARCVLEGPGGGDGRVPEERPSSSSSSSSSSSYSTTTSSDDDDDDDDDDVGVYGAWIRAMLDANPATRGYGRGGNSNNVAGFGAYITREAQWPGGGGVGESGLLRAR